MLSAGYAHNQTGRVVVFDKFLPETSHLPLARRMLCQLTMQFGTDINRRFTEITAGSGCQVISDEPSLLGGMYRVILLRQG